MHEGPDPQEGSFIGPIHLLLLQTHPGPHDSEGPSALQEVPAPIPGSVAATEGLEVLQKTCFIAPCLERPCWWSCGPQWVDHGVGPVDLCLGLQAPGPV